MNTRLTFLANAANRRAFVRAGRVTIRLAYQAGEWYPMWQLASGLGERGGGKRA